MAGLTFTALLLDDGNLVVDPGFVVDADPTPAQEQDDEWLEVVVLGRRRRPLARTRLALSTPCAPPVDGVAPGPARIATGVVDYPPGATGLAVDLDGRQIWEREAPSAAVAAEVDWPAAVGREEIRVDWRASTGEALAALAWSPDDGTTWHPLCAPTSSSLRADLAHVPGGERCRLEVLVTDGFSSQRLRSEPLALAPAGWRLWLLSPAPGAVLQESGPPAELRAAAYHVEERRASDDVTWVSSVDGLLGTGNPLVVPLSAGRHLVTATAHGLVSEVAFEVR